MRNDAVYMFYFILKMVISFGVWKDIGNVAENALALSISRLRRLGT